MKTAQEKNQHKTLVGLKILSSSCNKCKPMATHLESVCCLNKHEICECYFKGKLLFVFNIFLLSLKVSRKICGQNHQQIPLSEFFFSKVAGLNLVTTLKSVFFHM